mgnify:CR=1 FL=1
MPDGSRVGGKLVALDGIDKLLNTEKVRNIKQLQQRVTKAGASVRPIYWGRNVRPSRARPAMQRFDSRVDATLELISEAKCSPLKRRLHALRQQRLPPSIGGNGIADNVGCCAAEWVASVAASLSDVRKYVPSLAAIDVTGSRRRRGRRARSRCRGPLRARRAGGQVDRDGRGGP